MSLIDCPHVAHVDDFARCSSPLERVTETDHSCDGVLAEDLERTCKEPRLPISGNGIEKDEAAKFHGRQHRSLKDVGEDSV